MEHTMYDLLANPNSHPEFSQVIINHFILKKDYIKNLINKWVSEPNNKFETQTKIVAGKLIDELNKLN